MKENKELTKYAIKLMFEENKTISSMIKNKTKLTSDVFDELINSFNNAFYTAHVVYGVPMNDRSNFHSRIIISACLVNNNPIASDLKNNEVLTSDRITRYKNEFLLNYKEVLSKIDDSEYFCDLVATYGNDALERPVSIYDVSRSADQMKVMKKRRQMMKGGE